MMNDHQEPAVNPADQTAKLDASATSRSPEPPNEPHGVLSRSRGTLLANEMEALQQEVSVIRELIETRLSRDKAKEEAFNRLYEDLDRAKRHTAVLDNKSLYIDLMLLYDRMDAACEQGEHTVGHPCELFFSLREELIEILLRRDIHLISTVHDTFDPRFERAVSTEVCMTQEEDGKIRRVLREGFSCGEGKLERVIRPREVVIARFRPSTAADRPRDLSSQD